MGFRFYKKIKLWKFAQLNLSKSGVGISLGFRGLRLGTGPRGTHFSVGLPGTGLSYRKQFGLRLLPNWVFRNLPDDSSKKNSD